MRIETNLLGVGIIFGCGVALGYTIARAKFIELMAKASCDVLMKEKGDKD